jgi:type I restriction enzyme S subunit
MADWEVKTLGEVCEVFADGDWIEKKDQSSGGILLIQTGNIGAGFFKDRKEKARHISEKTFDRLRCTEIIESDCLISRLPDPVGRVCILPNTGEKMITAVDCTIVRFHKKMILSKWFIYYSLSHEYQTQIDQQVSGATRQRISRKNLGFIKIPLPSLTEQKRIVAILDEAFEKITKAKENAEKNLKNTKEVFESYLQSVFENKGDGWEEKKLGKIANFEYGYTAKSKENGDFRYVRITDIDSEGSLTNTKKVYLTSSTEAMNFIVQNNDLLMTRTGATFAKVLLYEDLEPSIFASYLIRIKFKDKIENKFYWYFSKSRFYWDPANKLVSGSAQPHFNGNALGKMIFSYPKSLSEQELMIKEFDKLSQKTKKLETIYTQKLTDLEELKKSIFAKAFNAELTEVSA